MNLEQFLNDLASSTPTPGGGSAAALAGVLSASLVAMVAGLSLKGDGPQKREMETIRKKALSIQKRLFPAIHEDSESFDGVMEAFRLPRNTKKESLHRARMVQKAYQKATVTPELVCRHSITLLEFCRVLVERGNPNAISDAGVAAYLANAALEGGILNTELNLLSIRNNSFRKRTKEFIKDVLKRRARAMPEILERLATGVD